MCLRNRVMAECFGTFALVFGGVGSAVLAGSKIHEFHVGVALAFGLALLAMVYTIGRSRDATSIRLSPQECCWLRRSARKTRPRMLLDR